jgi:hypothetical protein
MTEEQMVKITKLEYFEEKATDLEALVNSAFPQLETEAFIDQDEDSVSVQSELEVPGFEDTFFIEWIHSVNEEDPEQEYECSIFTAEGEELGVCYSNEFVRATLECVKETQELLMSVNNWLGSVFRVI